MTPVGVVVTLLVAIAGACVLLILDRHFSRGEQRILWVGYIAHVLGAVAIVWVTLEILGGGDLLDYHAAGLRVSAAIRNDFWEVIPTVIRVIFHDKTPLPVPVHGEGSATGSMMCLSALLVLVLGDSIYSACMAISVACFFSRLALYVAFRRALQPPDPRLLAAACMLVPSVTFWCSGMLKEPFAIFGLGIFFWAAQAITSKRGSFKIGVAGLAGLTLAGLVKPYLLLPFSLGLAAWLYLAQRRERAPLRSVWALVGAVVFGVASLGASSVLFPRYAIAGLAEETVALQMATQRIKRDSTIALYDPVSVHEQGFSGQLPYMPIALFTALFRPLLIEVKNPQMLIGALETFVFGVLSVIVLWRNGVQGNLRIILKNPVLGLCAVYVVVGSIGIGMATANLGSLSRYRSPVTPFFAVLLAFLVQHKAVKAAEAERSSIFRIRQLRS